MASTTRLPARDLALVATFAALIAVLGLPGAIQVGGGVPITLQTLGVMLAGAVLGARRGALAVLVFLGLVALGLPLLSGGRGGLAVFAGPSAGYLIGWVLGAFVVGVATDRMAPGFRMLPAALAAVVGGIIVVYAIGVPVVAARTHVSLPAALASSLAFLPGDLIKVALSTAVASAVHRALPGVVARPRRARDEVRA